MSITHKTPDAGTVLLPEASTSKVLHPAYVPAIDLSKFKDYTMGENYDDDIDSIEPNQKADDQSGS